MVSLDAFLREYKQHQTFSAWGKAQATGSTPLVWAEQRCAQWHWGSHQSALEHCSTGHLALEEGWIPRRYPVLLPSSLCCKSEADTWHWYLTALPLKVLLEFTSQNKKISCLFPKGWNISFSSFSLRLGGYILMHLQTKWNEMDWTQYNTACSAVVRITKEKLLCCVLLKPHHWHQV